MQMAAESLPSRGTSFGMTQNFSTGVAAAIRAEAARKRIGQDALAEALGLSQASISRRMRGATPFELDEIPVVARVLGVPVTSLLQDAA